VILTLVVIVVLVASISDYRKQGQFRALNDFGRSLNEVKVMRDGQTMNIPTSTVVVGDIVFIQTGDIIPSDGVLIRGFDIETDESTMTGEPHAIKKTVDSDPFFLSGTQVLKGMGTMVVIATGVNSLNGRSLLALEVEPSETPLQQKLGVLADFIAKFAFWAAASLFTLLMVIYLILNFAIPSDKLTSDIPTDLVKLFILAVTVVVVAVPEGLPLAVTLALAHATVQMLKDNNLVRNLSACETMGNATTICSDKTGTLTLNKMTVVRGIIGQVEFNSADIPLGVKENMTQSLVCESRMQKLISFVAMSVNINSTAGEIKGKDGKISMQGSKTEVAILNFTVSLGSPYKPDRDVVEIIRMIPFSSESKRMSCIVKVPADPELSTILGLEPTHEYNEWILVKGASEIIVRSCTKMLESSGKIVPMTAANSKKFQDAISSYAGDALRTIGAAVRPIHAGENPVDAEGNVLTDELILVALFGIEDPLRPEVIGAVASCQSAGVIVRMVTGDSVLTARAIARGCGILTADGLVMEGPEFRKMTTAEMDEKLPKLQVLARSSPLDKQILVKNLKRLGETVAVTGGNRN
jgi:P-type Ca2+ transporter type 2C